jgi:thymidylate synthase ThyX
MMNPKPKVTLVSSTKDPLETVYAVWQMSKGTDAMMSTDDVKEKVPREEVEKLFRAIIAQHIPIGEHVDFVFAIENISISWREQAVRHRIGTKPSPERVGADIVMMDVLPDLPDSSWWSQSMRIQDMSNFASRGEYRLPPTIAVNETAAILFHKVMSDIERAYKHLVGMGIPMEDARDLMPLGAQHRMSWKLNIGSLQHIVSKRGCFILQLGIWGDVIMGMIDELATKVHPIFRELVTPPCLEGDRFKGCVYMEECRRRLTGDDKLPPCPLHMNYHHVESADRGMLPLALSKYSVPLKEAMIDRAEQYRAFWKRDPWTGQLQ